MSAPPGSDSVLPRADVWLVRHAETEWSVALRHTGRTDIPLTDSGRDTARALAPRLAGHDFAAIYCSPLSRARETATLAGLDVDGPSAVLDEDLLEWDYGEYEGITTVQIREQRPGWLLWRDGAPGGEQPADIGVRVDRVIRSVCAVDGDVVIVGHGHLLRALTARWLGQDASFGARLVLATGAICVLGQERGSRALKRWGA